jgi:hypothetical protein
MGGLPRARRRQVTLWHEGFADCVLLRKPSGFEARPEVQLSRRPRRVDLLLLRRQGEHVDQDGRILRGLWPRLGRVTILELKSPVRGFRRSDLIRLGSYGAQYHADHAEELETPAALTLVLVVPRLDPALAAEIAHLGWDLAPLGNGYAELRGAWYTSFVVFTNEVAEAEHDDFLRIFSDLELQTAEAHHWLEHWLADRGPTDHERARKGYEEMADKLLDMLDTLPPERILRKYRRRSELVQLMAPEERLAGLGPEERLAGLGPEERLAGLGPEERLAGLAPEERLAGLGPEEQILALSDEVLRGFSAEFLRSLPRHVQSKIRKRLGTAR